MRSGLHGFLRGIAWMMLFVCLGTGALASGIETDDEGGIWDWDRGVYTSPDGSTHAISNGDEPESNSDAVVHNTDGSITITYDENDPAHNYVPEEPKEDGLTGDEAWAQGMNRAAQANGSYTRTFYRDTAGNETEVAVEYMGLARSMIWLNGEKTMVDTCYLRWETEAPEDKVLAVVTAKSYARLRAKSSSKSLVMDKCLPGQVMRVLATGKNWTFVDYKGIRGYVLTSSVTLYDNQPREYKMGWVATKSGHTYGNSTVHVRNSPKGKQQEEYPVGTPIVIFDDDGKWCQIEVEGHYCYIKREFVLYEEEAQTTASEGNG